MYFTPERRLRDRRPGGIHPARVLRPAHLEAARHPDRSRVRRHRPHGLHRRRHEVAGQLRVRQPDGRRRRAPAHACCKTFRLHQAAQRHAAGRQALSPDGSAFYVADMMRQRHLPHRRRHLPRDRLPAHRHRRPRAVHRARLAADVRHQPRRGHHQRRRPRHAAARRPSGTCPAAAAPTWATSPPTARVLWLSGRYNNVVYAISTVDGPTDHEDPGRRRTARAVRVAATRPLLARAHRHPALIGVARRPPRAVRHADRPPGQPRRVRSAGWRWPGAGGTRPRGPSPAPGAPGARPGMWVRPMNSRRRPPVPSNICTSSERPGRRAELTPSARGPRS